MVCRDCGKELDETNMVVGTSQETGEKVYFCTECFEKRNGVSIDTYERRKLIMKIVPFIALLAAYILISNVYVDMIVYFFLSMIVVEGFAESLGNDLIKLIAIFIMPFAFNHFSLAYHIFLFGFLLQLMGFDERKVFDMSALRRKYGIVFTVIGFALMIAGAIMGAYNLLK